MGGADYTFEHLHKMSNFSVSVYHNNNGKLKKHDPLSIRYVSTLAIIMAIITIRKYNPESIASLLNHVDSKRHFYRNATRLFSIGTRKYGNTIDEIVQPRPWWQIRHERIFERDHHGHDPPPDNATNHISALILDRIHYTLDTFMKFLVATHYHKGNGSAVVCGNSMLFEIALLASTSLDMFILQS